MIRHRSGELEPAPCPGGEAVRVLTKPFPFPSHLIYHIKARKNPAGRLGVKFVWDGRKGSRVQVAKINDESALLETDLQVGHSVIAINAKSVVDPIQASNLVVDAPETEISITAIDAPSDNDPPFCKLVTAPTSREHPGVSFDSTRRRCMVQVSRVFANGPFAGSDLHQGDVVLAVNGIPVSKPEEADAVLRLCVDMPNTILYVVDMTQYRHSILKELQITRSFRHLRFETCTNSCGDALICLWSRTAEQAVLDIDYEQQHLADSGTHSKNPHGRRYRRKSTRVVRQFLEAFNSRVDVRMRVLEEAVYCEAWNHGIQRLSSGKSPDIPLESSTTEEDWSVESSSPTIPTAEMEPPLVSASLIVSELHEFALMPHLRALPVLELDSYQLAASIPC